MTFCFIGIGSNENPEYHCQKMVEALRQRFGRIWVSSLKKTAAHGVKAADYVNGVVCFEANVDPYALKVWCRKLESQLGRVRGGTECTADLDILFLVDTLPFETALPTVDCYYQGLFQQVVRMVWQSQVEHSG